jgi:uncharacterized protein YuzB (UPF0349 family)
MEILKENVFGSPKASELASPGDSGRSKRLSETRYTPTRNEEPAFYLSICQDSLELPRPESKLVEFKQTRHGEEKHIIMPLFFHNKRPTLHQRQSSLKPVFQKDCDIGQLLLDLREKPKPKSSLKSNPKVKKQKTVSFCSQIEQLSPDSVANSVVFLGEKEVLEDSLEITGQKSYVSTNVPMISNENYETKCEKVPDTNTSTQQNLENLEEFQSESSQHLIEFNQQHKFQFESDVRSSLHNREVEFNEYSNIAFCEVCNKEIVTAVSFEKARGQSCGEMTEWILCWVFPDCMYKKRKLLHKCPHCGFEIARIDW